MANVLKLASKYGPGGRKCHCCGPSPAQRKAHDRTAKRREKQSAVKDMQKERTL